MVDYLKKYLKYKEKYAELKKRRQQLGGAYTEDCKNEQGEVGPRGGESDCDFSARCDANAEWWDVGAQARRAKCATGNAAAGVMQTVSDNFGDKYPEECKNEQGEIGAKQGESDCDFSARCDEYASYANVGAQARRANCATGEVTTNSASAVGNAVGTAASAVSDTVVQGYNAVGKATQMWDPYTGTGVAAESGTSWRINQFR